MPLNDRKVNLLKEQKGQVSRPFMITITLGRMMALRSWPVDYVDCNSIYCQILDATIKLLIWTKVPLATCHQDAAGSINSTVVDITIPPLRNPYGHQVH